MVSSSLICNTSSSSSTFAKRRGGPAVLAKGSDVGGIGGRRGRFGGEFDGVGEGREGGKFMMVLGRWMSTKVSLSFRHEGSYGMGYPW